MMSAFAGVLFGLVCMGVILLGFGGIGAFLLYRGWQQNKLADASKNWPAANGQITISKIHEGWSEDSDGDRFRSYQADVQFVYQVNGQTLNGSQIAFGVKSSDRNPKNAQVAVNNYPVGKNVPVYYNPANPGEAVLERRAGGLGVTFEMGIVFLVVAICMA